MTILIWFILVYFLMLWVGYIIFLIGSLKGILKKYHEAKYNNLIGILNKTQCLPITVIMPVYNYGKEIDYALDAILKANYPNLHLIIVNDGSTDNTLAHLKKRFKLFKIPPAFRITFQTAPVKAYYRSSTHPQITVIDKEHYDEISSGADAINAGLNLCKTPLFLTVDSDTLIETDGFTQMVYTYLSHPYCVAVGGNIYIPNERRQKNGKFKPVPQELPTNLTLGVQMIEYLRSFFYGHEGWSTIGGALCHSGAFTMFDKKAVMLCQGYDRDNYSYDSEIVMKLHHTLTDLKYPYTVQYAAAAFAWARQPSSLIGLWKQRDRWQRGLWRSFFTHCKMLFNPKYGKTGLIGFPYYVFFEIFGPVVEGMAYLSALYIFFFGSFDWYAVSQCILMAWSYIFLITLSCAFLNYLTYNKYSSLKDLFGIGFLTVVDVFFYRPYRALDAVYSTVLYAFNRLRGKIL
jgi:glycosyltransferase involved in cell wall biosynthesis